jgi:hypothetical protein
LAVASGILAGVASSGEAAGSTVALAGAGAAFGFAGAGAGDALAVASGFLAGVNSSVEGVGSTVAGFSVALGVAVDPGGQVIQHSAPAGNDRNANPVAGTSTVSRRDFAFMIHPPIHFWCLFTPIFPSVFVKRSPQDGRRLGFLRAQMVFGGIAARNRQI